MSLFHAMGISGSALSAQRVRMDVIANNVANVESSADSTGRPFRASRVVFRPRYDDSFAAILERMRGTPVRSEGVTVTQVIEDSRPGSRVFDPSHPDADEEGFVTESNVDLLTEMADLLSATRSYQANVTVLNSAKRMIQASLEIGR